MFKRAVRFLFGARRTKPHPWPLNEYWDCPDHGYSKYELMYGPLVASCRFQDTADDKPCDRKMRFKRRA